MFNLTKEILDKQLQYNIHRVKYLNFFKKRIIETYKQYDWDRFVRWYK